MTLAYIVNPLLLIYIVGSAMNGSILGLNPSLQRDRASITSAKSNTATICRAQAICLVENEPNQCNSFGIQHVDMIDPSDETWTYSFGANSNVFAEGHLSGTTFTFSCNNAAGSPDLGKVMCTSSGGGNTCKSLGVE